MRTILQRPIFLELKCTTGCGPHGFWHIDAVILIAEIITESTGAKYFLSTLFDGSTPTTMCILTFVAPSNAQ